MQISQIGVQLASLTSTLTHVGRVSLLKSKSRFLIQKRIIDPNRPQQRWILWIIQNQILWIQDPKHFFTKDSKRANNASGNSLKTIINLLHTSAV